MGVNFGVYAGPYLKVEPNDHLSELVAELTGEWLTVPEGVSEESLPGALIGNISADGLGLTMDQYDGDTACEQVDVEGDIDEFTGFYEDAIEALRKAGMPGVVKWGVFTFWR